MTPNNELQGKKWLMTKVTGGTGILPDGYFDNPQGKSNGYAVEQVIATGFDFEQLSHGDVLMQFFGDDGEAINTQVITKECLARIPFVAHALFLAAEEGKEAAIKYLNRMSGLDTNNFPQDRGSKP